MSLRHKIILGILLGSFGLLTVLLYETAAPKALRLIFFDIGQGDALFIETESGRQVLIDTGADGRRVLQKLADAIPFYDNTIDLLVLTHPDLDHIGGTLQVLESYRIGGVLLPYVTKDMPLLLGIVHALQEQNIPVLFAQRGDRVNLDEETVLDILWPPKRAEQVFSSGNDVSIVARLRYKNDSFLLTGDIEERGERALVALGSHLSSDVLKIGHHGSKTSTSAEFLQAVRPNLAIISVGENSYGHPNPEVLERLSGMQILRTDENGDITLVSKGDSF